VTAAETEEFLRCFDIVEREGARLLDEGANPAVLAANLYATVTRLQCEGRFHNVDVAKIEDVLGQIATAIEAETAP
jgi:hypothetical protein